MRFTTSSIIKTNSISTKWQNTLAKFLSIFQWKNAQQYFVSGKYGLITKSAKQKFSNFLKVFSISLFTIRFQNFPHPALKQTYIDHTGTFFFFIIVFVKLSSKKLPTLKFQLNYQFFYVLSLQARAKGWLETASN